MEKLTCLIVDDELPARRLLRRYADSCGAFEVLGEAASADAALELIQKRSPRVLFLDVQMPGRSGIELLAALPDAARHLIVFTTAFDQYAINAFNASAVDYLLKPFDEERFGQAVHKLRCMHAGASGPAAIDRLLEQYRQPAKEYSDRISCRYGTKLCLLEVSEIIYIEAAGNYSKAITRGGAHLLSSPISEMEDKLDPSVFIRTHRSYIVNTKAIASIRTHFNGEYKLEVAGGAQLKVSRSYKEAFNKAIGRL